MSPTAKSEAIASGFAVGSFPLLSLNHRHSCATDSSNAVGTDAYFRKKIRPAAGRVLTQGVVAGRLWSEQGRILLAKFVTRAVRLEVS